MNLGGKTHGYSYSMREARITAKISSSLVSITIPGIEPVRPLALRYFSTSLTRRSVLYVNRNRRASIAFLQIKLLGKGYGYPEQILTSQFFHS